MGEGERDSFRNPNYVSPYVEIARNGAAVDAKLRQDRVLGDAVYGSGKGPDGKYAAYIAH